MPAAGQRHNRPAAGVGSLTPSSRTLVGGLDCGAPLASKIARLTHTSDHTAVMIAASGPLVGDS